MAGLIGLFGSRALAWLILGGGGLFVVASLWQGAKLRGAKDEAGKWKASIQDQRQDHRNANNGVNTGTVMEQGSLQEQEAAIRAKWRTMGRSPETK